jgi:hypothetical protein
VRLVVINNEQTLFVAGEMVHRMMQLLEQNMSKQNAELQATAQERDQYRTKSTIVLLL